MSDRPNQRVALTKELVHRALIGMLKDRDIRKVSIRELCGIAGINRTTFYNHYGSQYDVLAEIRDRYLCDISRAIESTDPGDRQGVLNRVTLVLAYMERNIETSTLLIRNNVDESFAQRLFSLPQIEDMFAEALKDSELKEEYSRIVSFAVYGSYKLVQDWIADENRCSPAQMAALILTLAGAVCGQRGLGG